MLSSIDIAWLPNVAIILFYILYLQLYGQVDYSFLVAKE